MRKILMIGVILLAICVSISAVSADDSWSFNFSSSESSNSEGGAFSFGSNNLLQIQGLNYTIPDGYKENESYRVVGDDVNQSSMPEGSKITTAQFINGNDSIIIKAVFSDEKIDEYTPTDNAVEKEIAGQKGWIEEFNDGVCFDYLKDGKLVEIFTPDEKVLESILESADK
jgi:hypothetical protein